MAYYELIQIPDVYKACKSKMNVSCSIRGAKWYVTHMDIISVYEPTMRQYIGMFLRTRDLSVHLPDTELQRRMWSKIWDEGYVKHILEYEGFM